MRWAFCDDGFSLVNWGPFKSMFGSLLMTVVQFLCLIVYFIESVFWTLIRGVKMNDGSYKNIIDGLLFNNANLADNSITTIAGIDINDIGIVFAIIFNIFRHGNTGRSHLPMGSPHRLLQRNRQQRERTDYVPPPSDRSDVQDR